MKSFIFLSILFFSTLNLTIQDNTPAGNTSEETPEAVVNRQLEAYNARDIEWFISTYSEDIEIYDINGKLTMKGHDALRQGYADFFKNTPNLHCHIENRITINNKVIDKENVTAGERTFDAVAIYEVSEGKIIKVTFVR